MRFSYHIKKLLSKLESHGMYLPGPWRCRYKEGYATRWLRYGNAKALKELHGGTLEYRPDYEDEDGN